MKWFIILYNVVLTFEHVGKALKEKCTLLQIIDAVVHHGKTLTFIKINKFVQENKAVAEGKIDSRKVSTNKIKIKRKIREETTAYLQIQKFLVAPKHIGWNFCDMCLI